MREQAGIKKILDSTTTKHTILRNKKSSTGIYLPFIFSSYKTKSNEKLTCVIIIYSILKKIIELVDWFQFRHTNMSVLTVQNG